MNFSPSFRQLSIYFNLTFVLAFFQVYRRIEIRADIRTSSVPMFRRAGNESQIQDQFGATARIFGAFKHGHIEHRRRSGNENSRRPFQHQRTDEHLLGMFYRVRF